MTQDGRKSFSYPWPSMILIHLLLFAPYAQDTLAQSVAAPIAPLSDGAIAVYSSPEHLMVRAVTSDSAENGFFKVTDRYRSGSIVFWTSTHLLRMTASGNVERLISDLKRMKSRPHPRDLPEDGISEWYKVDVSVGQRWIAFGNPELDTSASISSYTIILESVSDSVLIGSRWHFGCYRYDIFDNASDESFWTDWLEPGVGLVKRRLRDHGPEYVLVSKWQR